MKELVSLISFCYVVVTIVAIKDGDPCTPSWSQACGEKILLHEEVHQCAECKGPNVCKILSTYKKHFYSYVYEKKCYGRGFCNLKCTRTDKCYIEKNVTVTKYKCCEGFAAVPGNQDYYHRDTNKYLKDNGCPKVIQNSILDCLEELGLTEFASLFRGLDLEYQSGSTNDDTKFTVFAPPNEQLVSSNLEYLSPTDLEIILGSHIVKEEIYSVQLFNGLKKETLSANHYIYVNKRVTNNDDKETTIFINGNKLTIQDACIAINGVVHVIEGVIDSSNETITDIVQDSPALTTLESLLTKADLLKHLNIPNSLVTLFAPTDTAFQVGSCNLGLDIVKCLLSNDNKSSLKDFLLYHIINGVEYSEPLALQDDVISQACYQVKSPFSRNMYSTECIKIPITTDQNQIRVGTSAVIEEGDIPASNGVIHHISLPLVNTQLDLTILCAGFIPSNCDYIY